MNSESMEADDNTPTRRHVIFQGRVQGVGFRYTTTRIAKRHRVTGTVRNLPNGTVEIVVEGEAEEIARFLDDVEAAFEDYVSGREESPAIATGEFSRFRTIH